MPVFTNLSATFPGGIRKYLVEKGADVNKKTMSGMTVLHMHTCSIQTAKYLIEKGADVNAKNYEGNTPLDCALKNEKPDLVAILRAAGGKSGKDLP